MEYYHMPWYQMPISIQRQLVCAVQQTQSGVVLTIGPLIELDFEMATKVDRFQFPNFFKIFNHSILFSSLRDICEHH